MDHVPSLPVAHTPHTARGFLYPNHFYRPAIGSFPADVAVLVPFQADDHPHVVFHRRGGLLHRWVQAIVRL